MLVFSALIVVVVTVFSIKLPDVLIKLGNAAPPGYPIAQIQSEFFEVFEFVNAGELNEQALTTLSASPASYRALLLVFLLTCTVIAFMQRYLCLSKRSAMLISLVTLTGNLFLFLQIDDLPDEGYVWASKVDNFIQTGQLGVQLDSGRMGESTVGFLQFLLATIPRIAGLTVEQSIYAPLWILITVSQILAFSIVAKYTKSILYSILAVGVIYTLPVLGLNLAFAFDNVMAYSFLVIWIFYELNVSTERKHKARIFLVAILPLVRLDFVVVSMGIVALHVYENKLFTLKSVANEVKTNANNYLFSTCIFAFWLIYKAWAFQELVPAMATYKGFHRDAGEHLYFQGMRYVVASLNLEAILSPLVSLMLILLLLRVFFWKWQERPQAQKILYQYSKQTEHLNPLLVLNFVFLALTTTFALIAGGDYFSPLLMRYQFPFLIIISLMISLKLYSFSKIFNENYSGLVGIPKKHWRLDLHLIVSFSILVFLLFFRSNSAQMAIEDIKQVDLNGRVTCEAAAAISLKQAFPGIETIATPEVNGFAYHSKASLIDLIALVDPQSELDGYIGDALHKFRITQNANDVLSTDVLWLYGGSECAESESLLTQENMYPERLHGLAAGWPGNFRVIDFNAYVEKGFSPVVIEFEFYSDGVKFTGKTFTFLRLK